MIPAKIQIVKVVTALRNLMTPTTINHRTPSKEDLHLNRGTGTLTDGRMHDLLGLADLLTGDMTGRGDRMDQDRAGLEC